MPLKDFCLFSSVCKISLVLRVGIYDGEGTIWDWQNILTDINDFSQFSFPTDHKVRMNDLLESGAFSDITLVCSDGQEIKSHKCILTACPYFRALLSKNFSESQRLFIKIDFDHSMMKIFLSFLYSGYICNKKVENWTDMFIMASFYGLEELSRYCELQMMTRVERNMEYIKQILHFAMRYRAFKLKKFLIRLVHQIQVNE